MNISRRVDKHLRTEAEGTAEMTYISTKFHRAACLECNVTWSQRNMGGTNSAGRLRHAINSICRRATAGTSQLLAAVSFCVRHDVGTQLYQQMTSA
jgi:hypothetical protein